MPEFVDRVVRHRLLPETRQRANTLAQLAGASRFVWNAALARNEELSRARHAAMKDAGWDGEPETRKDYEALVDEREFPKPDTHKFGLTRWFSGFRSSVVDDDGRAWLAALPSHEVRATLKDMGNAYKAAFEDLRNGVPEERRRGFPKFKSRHKRGRRTDGFWIETPSLKDGTLLIPQANKGIGGSPPVRMKLRRRGRSRYDGFPVKRARVVLDGGKWFVFLWHKVPEDSCEAPVRNREVVGIDRNTVNHGAAMSSPIALPDGEVADKSALPEKIRMLDARRRRYQREMSRKADAALRRAGWNGQAKTRRAMEGVLTKKHRAGKARRREKGVVATRREVRYGESQYGIRYAIAAKQAAKAAAEIRGVRENWAHQTARALARTAEVVGLEALNTKGMTRSAKGDAKNPGKRVRQKAGLNRAILAAAWGKLQSALKYKCGEVVEVNPAYTSRKCNECGEVNDALTLTDRRWRCPKCGTEHDRDINAALNIAKIACAGAETPGAILARGHGASAHRGLTSPIGGRPPPPVRRKADRSRERKPPPSLVDGPLGA